MTGVQFIVQIVCCRRLFLLIFFISTEANFEKCLKPVIHDNVLFVTQVFENPENIWPTIGLKWQC